MDKNLKSNIASKYTFNDSYEKKIRIDAKVYNPDPNF